MKKPNNRYRASHSSYNLLNMFRIRFCGSLYYLAPEIVRVSKSKPYNRKLDVWSMGVVAFTLSCGFLPFCFDNRVDTMKAIW
mmetsp:Transcript_2527/g.3842  ORF Transcript_2527/g.3842 Transcript_2527/m.3842 type:complete len:82 (+) Transcript_2527:773-1018(+)